MSRTAQAFYPVSRQRPELLSGRDGEHVWVMVATYRLNPMTISRARRGGAVYLDAETLASTSVGCYVGEQPWTEELGMSPCPGEP